MLCKAVFAGDGVEAQAQAKHVWSPIPNDRCDQGRVRLTSTAFRVLVTCPSLYNPPTHAALGEQEATSARLRGSDAWNVLVDICGMSRM